MQNLGKILCVPSITAFTQTLNKSVERGLDDGDVQKSGYRSSR